jgi:anti-sigma B factor antagonist
VDNRDGDAGMNFEARLRRGADESAVLSFVGVLDLDSAPDAEAAMRDAVELHPRHLVIDLREVTFMDSTGLRLIVAADAETRKNGRTLDLVKGPDRVHRVFRMTLMDQRLSFVDGPPEEPEP